MNLDFLQENHPGINWTIPLEPLPCPVLCLSAPEKFAAYEDVRLLQSKDYDDNCRPGRLLKVPANIPFSKNKQRATYGRQVEIVCESCGKRRAVYFEHKPSKLEVWKESFSHGGNL